MLIIYCSNYQALISTSAVGGRSPLPQVASSGFCKRKRVVVPHRDECADVMVYIGNYHGHLVSPLQGLLYISGGNKMIGS